MSMVSKRQKEDGPEAVAAHPDFQHPWIKELLADPQKKWTSQVPRMALGNTVTNSMFEKILGGPDCIRAHLSFNRPCREPDAVKGVEECWLLAIGHDIDGKTGRAHGGFNACVLDQIMGSVSHHANPVPNPPATANLNIDYKAPVATPCVILLRAWITETSNRKVWVKATIEYGDGTVCCASTALFVYPRPEKL
ncbi:hypothetical protein LTR37_003556 [Vermiconidia calcicola]|uniref:Uncharacterized protein n=1 Tax=Vermiconidia calcicola TaxID=1690605 RepID=A0ACC3NSG9_9PEZI|nr:hypothetical protein LTR37_003556 [Vermiconidia calcicola]